MLDNKISLITGCNRGIGRALLEEFARNGSVIYAAARKEGSLDKIIPELYEKYNVEITPVYFDLLDSTGIKSTFSRIFKEKKRG